MRHYILPVSFVVLLAACGEPPTESEPAAAAPAESAVMSAGMTGREAYEQVCADCHEEGVDGAPQTGDRDAWANRSQLWEAVLFEHAKDGFLDMPAKGGDEALDEAVVEKAAEYMLKQTFPDRIHAD